MPGTLSLYSILYFMMNTGSVNTCFAGFSITIQWTTYVLYVEDVTQKTSASSLRYHITWVAHYTVNYNVNYTCIQYCKLQFLNVSHTPSVIRHTCILVRHTYVYTKLQLPKCKSCCLLSYKTHSLVRHTNTLEVTQEIL